MSISFDILEVLRTLPMPYGYSKRSQDLESHYMARDTHVQTFNQEIGRNS